MPGRVQIAPSILAADFARLGDEVRAMEEAGADLIHVDVMDAHFVPALTVGPEVVRALRPRTRLPLDVHLMVDDPDGLVGPFADAGADMLTVHVEACPDPAATLGRIRGLGRTAGVSLNPETPASALEAALPACDLVLVMTVTPGRGGQAFRADQLPKIGELRARADALPQAVAIEVDGGVNPATAREATAAGADILVAGTAAFAGGPDAYAANLRALRDG